MNVDTGEFIHDDDRRLTEVFFDKLWSFLMTKKNPALEILRILSTSFLRKGFLYGLILNSLTQF